MWLCMGWLVRQVLRKKPVRLIWPKVSDDDFERVVLKHEIFDVIELKQKMVSILQNAGKTVARVVMESMMLWLKKVDISCLWRGY